MYQFALESYIHLFSNTIAMYLNKSTAVNDSLGDKLIHIVNMHKLEVYKYACRGLFEKDKLLLSIQMSVALATDIDKEEWNFFLRGSEAGIDRKQ
jgi:dynein heavy chain